MVAGAGLWGCTIARRQAESGQRVLVLEKRKAVGGHLPWRTLRFETEHLPRRDFQGATVVNYSDAPVPYTRIHEFRHYHPEKTGAFAKPQGTIITREYSAAWKLGDEPYYPIDNAASRELLAKYRQLVDSFNAEAVSNGGKLIVGGRLGEYRYYDMDKSIAAALALEGHA